MDWRLALLKPGQAFAALLVTMAFGVFACTSNSVPSGSPAMPDPKVDAAAVSASDPSGRPSEALSSTPAPTRAIGAPAANVAGRAEPAPTERPLTAEERLATRFPEPTPTPYFYTGDANAANSCQG